MTLQVTTTPEADAQIRTIDNWWRENRRMSPNLFFDELSLAFDIIAVRRTSVASIDARRSLVRGASY